MIFMLYVSGKFWLRKKLSLTHTHTYKMHSDCAKSLCRSAAARTIPLTVYIGRTSLSYNFTRRTLDEQANQVLLYAYDYFTGHDPEAEEIANDRM